MASPAGFDVEQFIKEVQLRPVLWDTTDPEYNHRQARLSAWVEVASNMYFDSENWSNYDKFGKVRDMQKRWKNIKDNFVRELKYEKKVKNGMVLAKKRKYLYSDLLDFLRGDKKSRRKDDSVCMDVNENTNIEEIWTNMDENSMLTEDGFNSSYETSAPFAEDSQNQLTTQENHSRSTTQDNHTSSIQQESHQPTTQGNHYRSRTQDSHSSSVQDESHQSTTQGNHYGSSTQENIHKSTTRKRHKHSTKLESHSHSPMQCCDVVLGPEPATETPSVFRLTKQVEMSSPNPTREPTTGVYVPSTPTSLELDDDKMFLLSLLPYFKKLKEDQKLESRIQITKIIYDKLYNNVRM